MTRASIEPPPSSLGMAYHWNGQSHDTIAVLEPIYTRTSHPWAVLGLVPSYVRAGRSSDARHIYDALLARRAREYVPPFALALCASALGSADAAFRHCGEAIIDERDLQFAA